MYNLEKVYIIGGLRTPIGKTGGALKAFLPEHLAAHLLNKLLEKYNLSSENIDELLLGNCVGPGGNIARLSLLQAGWPLYIPATTIDFQCGSSLKAIELAASLIQSGNRELVVAGGVESTSLEPNKQYHPNDPRFQGNNVFYTRAQFSPLDLGDPDMIQGAENAAEKYAIKREDMDKWAVESHLRALQTKKEKRLQNIICPLQIEERTISEDESIRETVSLKLMQRARAIIKSDGKLTSGNSCLTHDGAAIILMASERAVKKYGLYAEAEYLGGTSIGLDPNLSPLGPVYAVEKLLSQKQLSISQIDAIEINEAFAVKVLAFLQKYDYASEKINSLGGALAYGHPYGASGAIIILHLLEALKKHNGKMGIATLGIAGGQGIAALLERCIK
jgi:acetyl-CoA C-acetyltransferase